MCSCREEEQSLCDGSLIGAWALHASNAKWSLQKKQQQFPSKTIQTTQKHLKHMYLASKHAYYAVKAAPRP